MSKGLSATRAHPRLCWGAARVVPWLDRIVESIRYRCRGRFRTHASPIRALGSRWADRRSTIVSRGHEHTGTHHTRSKAAGQVPGCGLSRDGEGQWAPAPHCWHGRCTMSGSWLPIEDPASDRAHTIHTPIDATEGKLAMKTDRGDCRGGRRPGAWYLRLCPSGLGFRLCPSRPA